jgi:prevent-host-death family protein
MAKSTWTVAEAKAKFSEVLQRAENEGPQKITRRGAEAVVVVSKKEWERKTKRKGTLLEFFQNSPLRGSGMEIPPRSKETVRKIEL